MHRPTDADKFRIKEILEENDITHDILVQKIEELEVVSDEIKGLLHELKGVYDEHKWCLVNDEIEAYEADASNPLTPEQEELKKKAIQLYKMQKKKVISANPIDVNQH